MPLIRATLGVVTLTRGKKILREETYIQSRTLLESLHSIKECAVEPHTKQNIQILINQIHKLSPTK